MGLLEWFGLKPVPPAEKLPLIEEQHEALRHVHEVLEDQRKVAEKVGTISSESVRKLNKASDMIQDVIEKIERRDREAEQ